MIYINIKSFILEGLFLVTLFAYINNRITGRILFTTITNMND